MIKKTVYLSIFVILLCGVSTISANAQSDLRGIYTFQKSIDDGRNTLDLIVELRSKNVAVYRNEQEGNETQRRFGTWTFNKQKRTVTVIMPPVKKDPVQGQEVKLTFVFKIVGKNLKLVKDLPYNEGVGSIFERK